MAYRSCASINSTISIFSAAVLFEAGAFANVAARSVKMRWMLSSDGAERDDSVAGNVFIGGFQVRDGGANNFN